MAAVVDSDYSISANGDIRYTGTTTNNTVIEFHRWLQAKADDAVAAPNDLLDITNDTPSERSTDNIITLNAPYNIDDTLAEHLYDGSIIQDGATHIAVIHLEATLALVSARLSTMEERERIAFAKSRGNGPTG